MDERPGRTTTPAVMGVGDASEACFVLEYQPERSVVAQLVNGRFPCWNMGHALSDLDGPRGEVCQQRGGAAEDALLALVPSFALDP